MLYLNSNVVEVVGYKYKSIRCIKSIASCLFHIRSRHMCIYWFSSASVLSLSTLQQMDECPVRVGLLWGVAGQRESLAAPVVCQRFGTDGARPRWEQCQDRVPAMDPVWFTLLQSWAELWADLCSVGVTSNGMGAGEVQEVSVWERLVLWSQGTGSVALVELLDMWAWAHLKKALQKRSELCLCIWA